MARQTMRVLAAVGVLVLTLFVIGVGPASAWIGGIDGIEFTEDNDTNDGGTPNNVSDDGDNKHPSGKDRSVENGGSGNQGKSQSDPDGDSNGGADKPNGSGGVDKADQDGNNGCGNDDDFEDDNNGNCGGPDKDKDQVKDQSCSKEHGRSHGKSKGHDKSKGHGKKCSEVLGSDTECTKAMSSGSKTCDESDDDVEGDQSSSMCVDSDNMGDSDRSDSEACDDMVASQNSSDADDSDVLGSVLSNGAGAAAPAAVAAAAEEDAGLFGGALPFTGAGILPILVIGGLLVGLGYLVLRGSRAHS